VWKISIPPLVSSIYSGEAVETHLALVEPGHQLGGLGEGSVQTIEAPDEVGVASAHILKRPGKTWPIGFSATRRTAEDLLALSSFQRIELRGENLVIGRDAGIPNCVRHIQKYRLINSKLKREERR
jgi:hypothetical protein